MESTQPQLICASEFAPVTGESATPFSQQTVVLTKQDYIELKWEAHYWQAQHARSVEREAALKGQVEAPPAPCASAFSVAGGTRLASRHHRLA